MQYNIHKKLLYIFSVMTICFIVIWISTKLNYILFGVILSGFFTGNVLIIYMHKRRRETLEPSRTPVLVRLSRCEFYTNNPPSCPVCLDGINSGVRSQCGHTFHESCLMPWLSNHDTCPVCRQGMTSIV